MTILDTHSTVTTQATLETLETLPPPTSAPISLPPPPSSGPAPVPAPAPDPTDRPRSVRAVNSDDVLSIAGAAVSSLALVWVVYERLLAMSGTVGFFLSWYVAFLVVYAALVSIANPRTVVVDRLARVWMYAAAVFVGAALATVIVYTFVKGWPALVHLNFYTRDMSGVGPSDSLAHGGIRHAIVGTILEISLAIVISLPLGIGTAIYLTEVGGRLSKAVRTVVEAMTALPEILAGLFVYVWLIVGIGYPKTGVAVSIAMTITMVPIIARSGEVALRVVPGGLREAGLALGSSHWQTVRMVVLPSARAGLATALILSVARGIGETAIPLLVSGDSSYSNYNLLNDPMNSLPLFIFTAVRSQEDTAIARGFGAASVLLVFVLILFVLIRFLARDRGSKR